jgi:type I restriction enzyme, S subunit
MSGDDYWQDTTLGNFVGIQRGHDLTSEERKPGNVPVMGSAGQNGYHDTSLAKGPGVVIGRSGASFGQVHFSEVDYWPHNTILYVTDFKGNDPLFAYYLLKSINFSGYNSGSAQPSLNRNHLYQIPLRVPQPTEQRAIARVLRNLDDKIELNRRMNATLEAMAQALFRSWFVDFDPIRAKAEGRAPEGMDAATAALFPDDFQDSSLGLIPIGWTVAPSERIALVGIGKTPPRKESIWFSESPTDIPWISIRDLGNAGAFVSQTQEFLTPEAVYKFNVRKIPDNTVVLSFKLTMGRVAITDGEMLSNEAIAHFVLSSDAPFGSEYLYCYLKNFDYNRLGNTSSIATAVNSEIVRSLPILNPPKTVADEFTKRVEPLFESLKKTQRESSALAAIRDELLPQLLTGELRIPEPAEVATI